MEQNKKSNGPTTGKVDNDNWVWSAVDLLASEYGWAKDAILGGIYLDELFYLSDEINKRKLSELKLQLTIVQNPHVKKPEALWKIIEAEERKLKGPGTEQFDPAGFDILKQKLRQSSKIVVKY